MLGEIEDPRSALNLFCNELVLPLLETLGAAFLVMALLMFLLFVFLMG